MCESGCARWGCCNSRVGGRGITGNQDCLQEKKTFGEKSQKMLIVTSQSFSTTFTREETMNHFAEKHLTVVYCTNRTAENKGVYEVEL